MQRAGTYNDPLTITTCFKMHYEVKFEFTSIGICINIMRKTTHTTVNKSRTGKTSDAAFLWILLGVVLIDRLRRKISSPMHLGTTITLVAYEEELNISYKLQ